MIGLILRENPDVSTSSELLKDLGEGSCVTLRQVTEASSENIRMPCTMMAMRTHFWRAVEDSVSVAHPDLRRTCHSCNYHFKVNLEL